MCHIFLCVGGRLGLVLGGVGLYDTCLELDILQVCHYEDSRVIISLIKCITITQLYPLFVWRACL